MAFDPIHRLARIVAAGSVLLVLPGGVPAEGDSQTNAAVEEARRLIDIVHALEERYATIGPFASSFRQLYDSSTFDSEDTYAGTIHVRPDGRMSWVYDEPEGMRVVLDEERWSLLDPDLRHVTRRARDADLPGPAELLSGEVDILGLFAANFSGEPPGDARHVVLELVPRERREDLELLIAEIDPKSSDLRRVEILHPLGDRSVFEFGPPRAESEAEERLFRIDVPDGYEEIYD